MNDILYSVRALARTPGFTATAVLTLALGIGANTAVFSVVYAVLLRPLPYPQPSRLMSLHESLPAKGDEPARPTVAVAPPTTRDWAEARSFSSIAYYAASDFIVTGGGEPARIPGANVSWTFFDTLGMAPSAGRLITRDDDRPNQPLVCIIGRDLWAARFGSDPTIVGRTVELSGRGHTVVGIAAAGFAFPSAAQIWVPLALDETEFGDDQRLSFYLRAVGRLAPSATRDQAEDELRTLAGRLASRFPRQYEGRGATVVPLQQSGVTDVRPALLLLLGTVGCVLLIACVNVANLLLARGAARQPEMATRAALGASRGRMIRQLLAESLVLSFAAAAAGVLLAMWARDAIVSITPSAVPRIGEVKVDGAVLVFTLGLSALTAVVFGLAPALLTTRRALNQSLAGGRKGSSGTAGRRMRSGLVVAQLALSLALLTGAGLLTRTFWKLVSVDPGFDAGGVMTMEVVLPRAKYPEPRQRAEFFSQVLGTLESNPLVAAAGGATNLPLSNTNMTYGFYRESMVPGADAPLIANVRGITPGYFRALGMPLLRGRAFTGDDREGSAPVLVINDAMRRKFWPDQDPLGQRISITRGRTTIWREIVGIVGDVRHTGLGAEPEPEIYMPYAHDPFFFLRIAVRSSSQPEMLAGAMRAAVWAVDPAQPVSHVRTMEEVVAASVASQRFNAVLVGAFAVLALLLAAVGLYGVVAYSVALRLHEFGVRVALGAERRHLLGLVLRQSLALAGLGLVLGFGLAAALTRTIEAQLFATTTTDPATLGAVAGALVAIALVASYVPARRAAAVDPMRALRAQ